MSNYIVGEVDRISCELLKIDEITSALDEKLKIFQNKILYIEKMLGSKDRIMEREDDTRDVIDSMVVRGEWVSDLLNLIQDRFDSVQTKGELYVLTEMSDFLINEILSGLRVSEKSGDKDGKEEEK